MFVFTYALTQADWVEFSAHHSATAKSSKKARRFMMVFFSVLAVFISLGMTAGDGESGRLWYAFVVVTVFLAVFMYGFFRLIDKPLTALIFRLNVRLAKKDGKLPFDVLTTVTFEDEYILDISERAETKFFYPTVEKVKEGPKAIYIYVNAIMALVLPYRIFEGEEQKREFLQFMHGKVFTTE
ncbi:MAG: YcxB family protein [Defluviitaleaceae bacterium]|nr:YcxB family protein [Defluviitaleaceae bacterium]